MASNTLTKKDCPHCDPSSFALKHPLFETNDFWVVCDVHPLTEGHILIIPKKHTSCIGEYSGQLFHKFENLYKKFSGFIKKEYGEVSSFEHGKIGQTVFHSHFHLLPFEGSPERIVPEGTDKLAKINNPSELRSIFKKDGKYLFFSIGDNYWTVDIRLGTPSFFRDRFANALGKPERGNWKKMRASKQIMSQANQDIEKLEKRYRNPSL